jgi:DnaB-like helicase N terminal domain/AAA domain
MNSPPIMGRGGDFAATTPTNGFTLVDPTPLICAAQPWREPGSIELLNEPKPPHSVEAEKGVLSSMMNTHDGAPALALARSQVEASYFYVPAHRTIFTALCEMRDEGSSIDLITLTQWLRDANLLESVGGAAYVTELFGFVPTGANVRYYLEIVRDKYALREAVAAGTELVRRAYEEQDNPQAVLDEIESKVTLIRSVHGRNGSDLPVIEDMAELFKKPIVTPDDVINGLVHREGKASFGGGSKTFKTWLAIDTALSVATGTDFLGKFPVNQGRVLFLNFEIPAGYFTKRALTVSTERELTLARECFHVWNLRGYACDISLLLPRLLQRIQSEQYVMIILDPSYKTFGSRDEIKATDVASYGNELDRLSRETGAAVVYSAHFAKGNAAGKEAIDRVSGSGVFGRDADSIINFTRHEEENSFTVDAILRNHPPIAPFVVRWKFPLFVADDTLNPQRLKQAGGAPKQYRVEDLVALVKTPLRKSDIVTLARIKMKCSKRTAYDLVVEAAADGLLVETKDGEYQRPSPNGATT